MSKLTQWIEKIWQDFGPEDGLEKPDSLRVSVYGLWIAGLGFGFFLLWALFVPLSEGVVSQGSLVADGNRKTIQHLEGGIVAKVHIKEGEQVSQGQRLISLDQTRAEVRLNLLETRFLMTQAILDRLTAERSDLKKITWTAPAVPIRNERNKQGIRIAQENLFNARRDQLNGEIGILQEKVKQLEGQKKGFAAQLNAKKEELTYIQDELNRLEKLAKRGTVDLPRVLAQRKEKTQAEGMIARLNTDVSAAAIGISETRMQILQLTHDRRQDVEEKTMSVTEQLFELQEEFIAARDIYIRSEIIAPQAGKVIGLSVFTVGGVIPPGQPILDIVPMDGLFVRGRIKPTDADNVIATMPVRIRLSGLKQRTTPELKGTVMDVSGDAKKDDITGEQFFEVRIFISPEEFSRVKNETLLPGMPVEILIEAGKRTAMEYFLDPITDLVRRSMRED
ncbi:HlyD family type I secretion periplasmic adaptor subunit [Temperatibacter marinus]|uniref:Membrane fusion protein (MFP) family protein n=1 Tax=Temperatibacter marinus TaxID=1456591 RepID=A0AA52EJ83_9PROT|nr:HlyD family type I secretion periplasmic adaptor subunit [Temperatibacter marinus]WND03041.1 HlyD family type I secretion periplasmic adaptor subunit [Temperatibacter marinus]